MERKLIDKNNSRLSSSSKQQSSKRIGGKKKHWIRLRQSIVSSTQKASSSPQVTLPRKPSFTGLKKTTSLGSSSLSLPPSGKSSSTTKKQSTTSAVRKGSAPPTYFNVDVARDQHRKPRDDHSSSSVGYYSAPILLLRPDLILGRGGLLYWRGVHAVCICSSKKGQQQETKWLCLFNEGVGKRTGGGVWKIHQEASLAVPKYSRPKFYLHYEEAEVVILQRRIWQAVVARRRFLTKLPSLSHLPHPRIQLKIIYL